MLSMIIFSDNRKFAEEIRKKYISEYRIEYVAEYHELMDVLDLSEFNLLIFDKSTRNEGLEQSILSLQKSGRELFIIEIGDKGTLEKAKVESCFHVFAFLERPVNMHELDEILVQLNEVVTRREEIRDAGLYHYITKPVTKGDVDKVISVIYDYMTKPITKDNADKAMKSIYQYITTPITNDDLEHFLKNVVTGIKTSKEKKTEVKLVMSEDDMLGESRALLKAKKLAEKVGPSEMTALIIGESGVGKELMARTIFKKSLRKDKPYIIVNCAAISPSLIESELFGYEKGAFTGALGQKKGIIEEADGGTLFLDEIGDMDINSQAKLLRVIENGELRKVGGNKTIKVNVRFIAATNQKLEEYVANGKFRNDLYYRLMNFPIYMPALRERKYDIPLLYKFFLYKIAEKMKRDVADISEEAMKVLREYDYPGNVRELKNLAERLFVISNGITIEYDDIPEEIIQRNNSKKILQQTTLMTENRVINTVDYRENKAVEHIETYNTEGKDGKGNIINEVIEKGILNLEEIEKAAILSALERTGWNRSETIKLLGIGRTTLYEKMKKYNFEEKKDE